MYSKLFLFFVFVFGFTVCSQAQDLHTYLRKGNQSYRNDIYVSAEENYRKIMIHHHILIIHHLICIFMTER